MKKPDIRHFTRLIVVGALALTSICARSQSASPKFPYKKAGLTTRQAAAHLLDRLSYGATPGQVDSVVKMGLENWFNQQLAGTLPDDSLDKRLSNYADALHLTNTEICKIYPPGFVIRSMAIKDSVISKDSIDLAVNKKALNEQIQGYMQQKGFKSDQDLYKQFISQNIVRAAYTRNQLEEVLTDFWFNHFNVSFFKGECAQFIPAYERDVIRPNVLGNFDQLLLASAQSPAMLYYLDNYVSVGPPAPAPAKAPAKAPPKPAVADSSMSMMMMGGTPAPASKTVKTLTQPGKNVNGLNENYAREVMELHTLGVDGGYTQQDVTQAARVLTGWTVYPISDQAYGSAMKSLVAKIGENNLAQKGYVRRGDFLFTPSRHDQGEKTILGRPFPASTDPAAGYQEGVELLEMLAHHPSCAKFICKKLATRFVSDNPPASLINKMAKSFTSHNGEIRAVLVTMVNSPEFWNKNALRAKIKSPFELAISSVRALNADITDPYPLFAWISKMGEKRYYYQAPTGFPDRGQYWVNSGSLLSRMGFSLALTSQQIAGIKVNLAALNNHHEPESAQAALTTYTKLLMPERNTDQTVSKLTPLLSNPDLAAKVNTLTAKITAPKIEKPTAGAPGDMMFMSAGTDVTDNKTKAAAPPPAPEVKQTPVAYNNKMLPLVTGIIIGSPEFQRR
jgi:uncharacterized protein (DUF1800 family)